MFYYHNHRKRKLRIHISPRNKLMENQWAGCQILILILILADTKYRWQQNQSSSCLDVSLDDNMQQQSYQMKCIYSAGWGNKVHRGRMPGNVSTLTSNVIIELHFYNGLASARHCSPQLDMWGFIFQPTATWLRTSKVTEVFPVIHLVVQMFIAGTGMLNHTHCKSVLVQVVVKGDREHDGCAIRANPALHVEEVVGQQADSTCGSVVILCEGAHFGLGGANGRLGRVLTEATCHVYPIQARRRQIRTITTNQLLTFMSHTLLTFDEIN